MESNTEPAAVTTTRPSTPLVHALEHADPAAAFLEHLRTVMAPGPWQGETEAGFWWIPHRLEHTIEVFTTDDGAVCRSDFVLVTGIDDVDAALRACAIDNRRPVGGALWFDHDDATIHLTSSVRLDPQRWFDAHVFEYTVARLVGICEHRAPLLADAVGGRVAVAGHPRLGMRDEPDQFVTEILLPTLAPEAGTGLWWSRTEVSSFSAALTHLLDGTGGATELVPDPSYRDDRTSARNLASAVWVDSDECSFHLGVDETHHPDLGFGLELLVAAHVRLDDAEPGAADRVANMLNAREARACRAPLAIGAWITSDGHLRRTTFVMGEVARTLQQLAAPRAGETLAVMVAHLLDGLDPLRHGLEGDELFGVRWSRPPHDPWGGIAEHNAPASLLCDDVGVTAAITAGVDCNVALEPIPLDAGAWVLQRRLVIASMGTFNPMGPTVGTIELIVNETLERALIVERGRHPYAPFLRLRAVLDGDGLVALEHFVEETVASLGWDGFDWFDIHHFGEAIERGLRRFAAASDLDVGAAGRALLATQDNPWLRIAGDVTLDAAGERGADGRGGAGSGAGGSDGDGSELGGRDGAEDGDDVSLWIHALTAAPTIDAHLAFLRSAWEGAAAFARNPRDPGFSQTVVQQCVGEVLARGGVDETRARRRRA